MTSTLNRKWGAAILVIGDEILSGRTQDTNTNYYRPVPDGFGHRS